jgi:cyanate permease
VPQFAVWTFALVWLMSERGWGATSAGLLVGAVQLLGALARMAAGQWSDRVGSRLGPLRWVAAACTLSMIGLALTDMMGTSVSIVLLVIASVTTVSPNGLAFTAVAENAGPYWSGRALGIQNTGQFLVSALVPPVLGLLITSVGYPAAWAASALAAAIATPVAPPDPKSRAIAVVHQGK